MMINKELLGWSNPLLNLRLEGYCAASSAVIGQIHWDFLSITGSWWDLNNFPLEADKTAFFFFFEIHQSVVYHGDTQTCSSRKQWHRFKASPGSVFLWQYCAWKGLKIHWNCFTLLLHVPVEFHETSLRVMHDLKDEPVHDSSFRLIKLQNCAWACAFS